MILPKQRLLFKYHTVSQDTHKYNFSDGHMKNIAFSAQISMQLMNIQQYDIPIYYTEFHQNYAINAACTTRNSFTPLTKDYFTAQILTKITVTQ